ncbi:MAG: hypothetical protein J7K82_07695 [Thermoproteales archaeon]|nr:hypothetical protein [Thermoproteales archaeon]
MNKKTIKLAAENLVRNRKFWLVTAALLLALGSFEGTNASEPDKLLAPDDNDPCPLV